MWLPVPHCSFPILRLYPRQRLLLSLLLLCSTPAWSQEICDNGVDDDGDGLVDLNDRTDCSCSIRSTTPSLLPNPSFERYAANQADCTTSRDDGLPSRFSQINCVEDWRDVSKGNGDAFHILSFFKGDLVKLPRPPPYVPGGLAMTGLTTEATFVNPDDYEQYREYMAACLRGGPLRVGEDYRLAFDLGFGSRLDFNVGLGNQTIFSPSSTSLVLYGLLDCRSPRYAGWACPEAAGESNYEVIGEIDVSGSSNGWTSVNFDFTAGKSYTGLALGGSCEQVMAPRETKNGFLYYFVDELRINRREEFDKFTTGPIRVYGSLDCSDEFRFEGQNHAGAAYQWYLDGVALPDATSRSHRPRRIGEYVLRISLPNGCSLSEPINLTRLSAEVQPLPASISVCKPTSQAIVDVITLPIVDKVTYNFPNDFSGTNTLRVRESGRYTVEVVKECLTYSEEISVTVEDGPAYQVTVSPIACENVPGQISLEVPTPERYAYTWRNEDGVDLNVTTPTLSVAEAGEYTVGIRDLTDELCTIRRTFTVERNAVENLVAVTPNECGFTSTARARVPGSEEGAIVNWYTVGGAVVAENQLTVPELLPGKYELEITDTAGCTVTEAFTYAVPPATLRTLFVRLTPDCTNGGTNATVSATGGAGALTYQIGDRVSADPDFTALPFGPTVASVTDTNGCTVTNDTLVVETYALPSVSAGEDGYLRIGDSITINANVQNGAITWAPSLGLSCIDCPNPTASPTATTTYVVTARDRDGCLAADSLTVIVDASIPIYIPTAFSPNDDGVNDEFSANLVATAGRVTLLSVYDRWGGLVHEAQSSDGDPVPSWDGSKNGKPMPGGAYAYRVQVLVVDGRTLTRSGFVSILR